MLAGDGQAERVDHAEGVEIRGGERRLGHVEVFRMGCVVTPIVGRPRPLSRHRHAQTTGTCLYTLICEEPVMYGGCPWNSFGGSHPIEFDLPDHFTAGLMASSAQRTAAERLEEAQSQYPDADRYYVWINGEDGPASNAAFEPETLDSLDLEDRTLNVFEHLDAGSAHPELLD